MRKFFVLVAFSVMALHLQAQLTSITWGPEMTRPRRTDIDGVIGADKDYFYCQRTINVLFSAGETALEKYSRATMQLEYVKEFMLPEINGRQLHFERVFILKEHMLVFATMYDKDQDKNFAYVQKISTATGNPDGPPREIDYIASDKKRNSGSFDFVLSADSSKILLLHNEPFEKYAHEKFSYKVLDANANEIWSAALELPYTDQSFTVSNYQVDNDGNVFMLASITKDRSDRVKGRPNYHYELISYFYKTKSVKETEISLENKFVSDISFRINEQDHIVVGGFYSNKTSDGIAGTFFLSMDKESRNILSSGYKDFSTQFLTEFMSARKAQRHRELYDYSVDHLITKNDGGAYIVGEQYYIQVVNNYDMRTGAVISQTYHYYYNDIIVISVNPDASIAWVKRIPKYQHTTNDYGYFSSYSLNVVRNKLYFLYNDHPKNLNPGVKNLKNGISRKQVPVLASLNADGTMERNILFNVKELKLSVRPKLSIQTGPRESLFYAIKKKQYKFGRMNY